MSVAVFSSLSVDIVAAFFLGLLGGIAAELIDNKGSIGIPFVERDEKNKSIIKVNLGLISKMIVGGVAALAFFFLVDTTDAFRFVGATVAAGFGGSATLVAVKEKILGGQKEGLEKVQSVQARQAVDLVDQTLNLAQRGLTVDASIAEIRGKAGAIRTGIEQTDKELKELR